jgi:2-oxoglutarate dehydrogenase E2 component (dihydrolipoamide succinyltransferase)
VARHETKETGKPRTKSKTAMPGPVADPTAGDADGKTPQEATPKKSGSVKTEPEPEIVETAREASKDRDEAQAPPDDTGDKTESIAPMPAKIVPVPPVASNANQKSASGPDTVRDKEIVPMTMLRRTVARHLVEARQTMAMLTTFNELDMTAVQALRKEHQEAFDKRYQVKLGLMSFFVKAVIDALKQFPQLNAEIRGNDIVYYNYFDLGVAIASERGLVVPVVRNAERLSFAELEKAIGDFARRAKEGKLKPDDLAGGTFTITNGGAFGSLLSTPIINPPQTGILGMHTIQERPVAVQGQVVIRPMMYLALTYDHRLVDGREAVLFLRRIKEGIEAPARLLLEI